ncbi:hypothetical protein FNV43_RR10953 [Rhamnella rubrinervis]|uniref:Uncharacterized protein n=1 Tax=Rhamnella rubrinervis TaxID=2594499 RepID=A0A8K0MH69_9ROSA|nr:hypothetical protein FNV43_RR10953 [Rhamnella rubrinervis]
MQRQEHNGALVQQGGKTDSTGTYKISINEDHENQLCDALLVSSPRATVQQYPQGVSEPVSFSPTTMGLHQRIALPMPWDSP